MAPRDRAGTSYALYYVMYGHLEEARWDEAFRFLEGIGRESIGRGDDFAMSRAMWARFCAGLSRLFHGELDEAEAHGQWILATAGSDGFSRLCAQAQFLKGSVALQRNQIDQAAQSFRETTSEPLTGILVKWEGLFELARAATLIGDDRSADNAVSRLFDTLSLLNWTASIPTVRALQAEIALLRGDFATAVQWAETTAPDPEHGTLASVITPALIRARILLSEPMRSPNHLREAAAILEVLDRRLDTQHIHRCWIAVRTLQAVLLDLTGSPGEALRLLTDTIDGSRGHIRPFLDQGPHVAELLERLVQRDGRSGMRAVLLDASRAEMSRRSPAIEAGTPLPRGAETVEVLSAREREILAFLAARHSNKEIAQQLGISPLTVKRHTINLYAKLGVSGRREAVQAYYRST
jgi:LuxR family maltose regulon positive regulatory protein